MASPDLSAALYAALSTAALAASLAQYGPSGERAIFTRRPVPADAPFPMIVSGPDAARTDQDMLSSQVVVVSRDVIVYGRQPADYRVVEAVALAVVDLFHRQKFALSVSGWRVLDIRAGGPVPGPVDSDSLVARAVTLTIRLCLA